MSNVTTITPSTAFSLAAYLRAKVPDSLSDQCHAHGLLFDALNHDEMADAYREAHHALAEQARKLFPHPEFVAGRESAHANGFDE